MKVVRRLLALLMLIGMGTAALAAEVSIPPSPARWATDTAGFLKPQTVADLDARLQAYQSETGHQVLVYVTPTTGDTPTEDWTVRAFKRWKAGRKGIDDGLILFVFSADRKVRIEVGYGLEQTVPDATAARIIRDTITPKLHAGQPDAAVTAGVDEILGTISGVARGRSDDNQGKNDDAPTRRSTPVPYVPDTSSGDTGEAIGVWLGVLISLLVIVGIGILISKLPTPKDTYVSSRSDGWGTAFGVAGFLLGGVLGGGGGGGFSGGGGMSGGGGATGSW